MRNFLKAGCFQNTYAITYQCFFNLHDSTFSRNMQLLQEERCAIHNDNFIGSGRINSLEKITLIS